MKTTLALTAIASSLFLAAPLASADEYATLSNYGDSIELKEGETALLVSSSRDTTVQYDKKTWPVRSSQFKLGATPGSGHQVSYKVGSALKRFVPSWTAPFPLAGPCKIKLMTPGVVSMRVVTER